MNEEVTSRVWQIAEPVAQSEGLEIVDIEYRRERAGMVLRLFVDRADSSGVTLDELTMVSRQLSDLLDVHDVVPGAYVLEVSSPGINRRLRRPDHFRRYVGQQIRVRTAVPVGERKVFTGRLAGVSAEGIEVEDAHGAHYIPFPQIAQANLEIDAFRPVDSAARSGKQKR